MKINYLDKNLLENKDSFYATDKDFLTSIRYYVRRKCSFEKYDEELEKNMYEKYKYELKDIVDYYISIFKENFSKAFSSLSKDIDITNNEDAYNYLYYTYPYCLFKDGKIDTKDLDSSLLFFAKHNLNADESMLENVIPTLKLIDMRVLKDKKLSNYESTYGFYRFGDIIGTMACRYRKPNLYETLHALDDYNLKDYINYIMVMNGLMNPSNIIKPEPVLFVDDGEYMNMLYVVEGNHRAFTCKALYEITRLVTLNSFNNDTVFYNKVLKKNK